MNLIPTTDLTDFMRLPLAVRNEIELWHRELQSVGKPYQVALKQLAGGMGVSFQTARRKFYAWKKDGWRGLVNRAKAPDGGRSNLDPEFIEYWKSLCEQNGRKCRPAYKLFLREFRSGKHIPGIPAGTARHSLPLGFSYDNLMRFRPTQLELAASRIGRSAADRFRPKLFTTRKELQVGQRYVFDDMWHDFKVVMLGHRKPGRLLQLHALDLFSACQFARGLKPRLEDPETGSAVGLKADEMLFLLAHVLTDFGFHPDGCVLMVEHGTAALSELIEQQVFDLTGGKVVVDRSGIGGASAFAGQYAGRGKGNFRFKAALESLGNLIHNETANLLQFPGQTGSNSRLNLPEELHGRERHMDQLALALVQLSTCNPQLATALRLPFLEVNQARWLVEEIMERINCRKEHELEGWVEAGLTTIDFQLPVQSLSETSSQTLSLLSSAQYLALAPSQRAAVDAIAKPAPRLLSPREVFDAGRSRLARFRPEQIARLLLLAGNATHEVYVNEEHLIVFEDKDLAPSALRYLAHHFAPGDKFEAVVNPWALDSLHLFDAQRRWVGVVDAWQTISMTDTEALHAQMGRAAKIEKELLAPLAARGADLTRKRLEDSRHNSAALGVDVAAKRQTAIDAEASLSKVASSY
jgi:hypothetical protein